MADIFSLLLKIAIEIVDFPIQNGDVPIVCCKRLPEANRDLDEWILMDIKPPIYSVVCCKRLPEDDQFINPGLTLLA